MKNYAKISIIALGLVLVVCLGACDISITDRLPYDIESWHEHSWDNWELVYSEENVNLICHLCGSEVMSYPVSKGLEIEDGVLIGRGTCEDEYIVVPQGVSEIGENAFSHGKDILGVLLPPTLTEIRDGAFEHCDSLQVINIPEGVTSIGDNAFFSCKALIGVLIPNSVKTIGRKAFSNCGYLEIIYYVGDDEEWNAISKGKDWNKGAGKHVVEFKFIIGENPIPDPDPDLPGMEEGEIFNGLEFILNADGESYSVAGVSKEYYNYTPETIIIPDTYNELPVTRIADWAFSSNERIKHVVFSESSPLEIIGDYAFAYIPSFTSINIPDSVIRIGEYAFDCCDLLKEIYIPDLVEYIGILALGHCDSLEKIEVSKNNLYYTSIDGNLYTKDEQTLIQYAIGRDDELFNIPDFVVTIGDHSLHGSINLKYVSIPNSVEKIGDHAFAACKKLKSVVIPNSVTELGYQAFFCCSELSSVVLSESLYGIPEDAFTSCYRLSSITIPKSIQGVGERAFYKCYSLVEIINQSHINITAGSKHNGYIGYYALHITNDASQSYLQNINDYIFYDDGMDVHLITYIGDSTELVLPAYHEDKSYDIYDHAFVLNEDIQSVIIPEGVTKIGEAGFYWCHGLKKVVLPNSLTYIGKSAFCEAHLLESINLPLHLEYIGDGAFTWNYALKSIVIPRSVTYIGSDAFYGATSLTIYCERSSKPGGWESNWNAESGDVVWGYTGE